VIAAAEVDDLKKIHKLYYDSLEMSSFSSRQKLQTQALKWGNRTDKIGDWLLRQDAYILHRPARKKFCLISPYCE